MLSSVGREGGSVCFCCVDKEGHSNNESTAPDLWSVHCAASVAHWCNLLLSPNLLHDIFSPPERQAKSLNHFHPHNITTNCRPTLLRVRQCNQTKCTSSAAGGAVHEHNGLTWRSFEAKPE
ncbi:unnamed protein product [Calypogeia fissa]